MTDVEYVLTQCSKCNQWWVPNQQVGISQQQIGRKLHISQSTVRCPICGYDHAPGSLPIIETAADKDSLQELRSQLQAKKSGYEKEYARTPDYVTQKEVAEDYLSESVTDYDRIAESVVGTVGIDEYNVSTAAAEAVLGTVGTDEYDISTAAAEAVLGTVGADEHGPSIDTNQDLATADRNVKDATTVTLARDNPEQEIAGEIVVDGQPPSDIWTRLADELRHQIASSVRSIVDTADILPPRAVAQAIAGGNAPTLREQIMGSSIIRLSDPDRTRQFWEAMRFVRSLGSGECLGGIYSGIDDVCKVARLIDVNKPIVIRIGQGFESQRADQRRDICRMLTALSADADIRIVTKTLRQQRWLAHAHEADLPGSLIEQCNTGQNNPSPKSETVQEAIERFNIDGGIIEVLRSLAGITTETRTLDKLEEKLDVKRDTIHNRLYHLREYNLISETLSTPDGSAVSLTSTGRAYLDAVDESAGIQATLEESLIATGKSSNNMPCNPACPREGGRGWGRNRLPNLHELRQIPRHRLHAATATVDDTDISVVDTDVDHLDDRAAPGIHYDHENRTLLVSAEYDNPMNYWVSIARALSNEKIWSWILTEDKLKDGDCAKFLNFFDEHKVVLRQLRCLGYLPDRIENIDEFRDLILDAKDDLLEMTKRETKQDYPEQQDRSEFRSTITSDAHGLAGTMVHIVDLVDVEIIREVRVPRYREFSQSKKKGLVKTLGKGVSIQSVYGEAACQRQLYERREEKRGQAIEVDVDSRDPYAEFIGSFAIVGDFKSQKDEFVDSLTSELQPQPPHEDAPKFQIRVSLKDSLSRIDYVRTLNALCEDKNLKPTPQAISTFAGICNSPYEAAAALNHLQPNDDGRSIDAAEVRFAMAQLGPDDILRGATSTPRKAVIALLNATEPLSQSELADRADVSARSLRDHLDDLIDLGLIAETPSGYRFELSFSTGEERTDGRYPMYVINPDYRPHIHKAAKALRVACEHYFDTPVPDDEFPTGPTGSNWCVDLRGLEDPDPWIWDVLPLLWGLELLEEYRTDSDLSELVGHSYPTEVRLGPDILQERLAAYSSSDVD